MRYEQRRAVEARAGTFTFLAGVWLVMAPPLLHFDASAQIFRPYWAPMVLAVLIMLMGLLRAMAPLDLPWARSVTVLLAASVVVTAVVERSEMSGFVQVNLIIAGAGVALVSVVVGLTQ